MNASESAEPKASSSAKDWVEKRPMQAVLAAAVVALLVGGVLGLGVGYKVEHDRVAKDVSRLRKELGTTTKKTKAKSGSKGREAGQVTVAAAGSLTLRTSKGATLTVNTSATTAFSKVTKGTASDIAVGRHVLVVAPGVEVLVLPAGSTFGRAVTSSSADSFSLAAGNGLVAAKVKVTSATVVDTLTTTTSSSVKATDQVMALGNPVASGPLTATDVIVLPSTSAFIG